MVARRNHGSLIDLVYVPEPDSRIDPKPRARHPEGRACAEAGCTTILSTYNAGTRCYVHAEPKYPTASRWARSKPHTIKHPNRLEKREVCFVAERSISPTGMRWETGLTCYLDKGHDGPHDFH